MSANARASFSGQVSLLFDQSADLEGVLRIRPPIHERRPHGRFGDGGVLERAELILDVGQPCGQPPGSGGLFVAQHPSRQLGGVSRPFRRDSRSVKVVFRAGARQLPGSSLETVPRVHHERRQGGGRRFRRRRGDRRTRCRGHQLVEQRCVDRLVEDAGNGLPRRRAASLQRREEGRERRRRRTIRGRQALDQDVEVTGLSQSFGHRTQVGLDPRQPGRLHHVPERPKVTPQAAQRYAELMQPLRIADPRERVVSEQPEQRIGNRGGERVRNRRLRRQDHRRDVRRRGGARTQGPDDLGNRLRIGSAGDTQLLGKVLQRRLVRDRFQLELAEAGHDATTLENRDLVVGELGHLHLAHQEAPATPPGSQRRNRHQRLPSRVCGDELASFRRRLTVRAVELELVARHRARTPGGNGELERPCRTGRLPRPVAEGDPVSRQPQVGGVEVGGPQIDLGERLLGQGRPVNGELRDGEPTG